MLKIQHWFIPHGWTACIAISKNNYVSRGGSLPSPCPIWFIFATACDAPEWTNPQPCDSGPLPAQWKHTQTIEYTLQVYPYNPLNTFRFKLKLKIYQQWTWHKPWSTRFVMYKIVERLCLSLLYDFSIKMQSEWKKYDRSTTGIKRYIYECLL